MSTKRTILIAAFIGTAFLACHKPEHPGFEKSASGLFYKELIKSKDTTHANYGDRLTLQIICKTEKDCVLIDTRRTNQRLPLVMRKSVYPGDVFQAIKSMKLGDSTEFLLGAKDYFEKLERIKLPAYIDSSSLLYFNVKIDKIEPKEIVEAEHKRRMEEKQKMDSVAKSSEPVLLEKYLTDNKIKTKPNKSGLYFIETQKGKGDLVKPGQTVSVIYTGKFLTGEVFDATDKQGGKPIDLQAGTHQVIPGWDEALLLMRKGGKASVIIPSSIGYGDGMGGRMKPYTTLLFDMEIVDVKDSPPAPANAGMNDPRNSQPHR